MSRQFFGLGDGDIRLPDDTDSIHIHHFRLTTDHGGAPLVGVQFGHAEGLPPDACPNGCAASRGVMEWDAAAGKPTPKQRPCWVEDGRGWHDCTICEYYSEARDVIGVVHVRPDATLDSLRIAIKTAAHRLRAA